MSFLSFRKDIILSNGRLALNFSVLPPLKSFCIHFLIFNALKCINGSKTNNANENYLEVSVYPITVFVVGLYHARIMTLLSL